MKNVFVQTSNVLAFNGAISDLRRRGADEACLVVVDGKPGLGKTSTLSRFASQQSAVYLRCKAKMTANWLLSELLRLLHQDVPHASQARFDKALEVIAQRQVSAMQAGKLFALVFDEADHISRKSEVMETIRDLSDVSEVPTVLVGMGKIRTDLERLPQVASRVSRYVNFKPATFADVRALFDQKCEVPVTDDLVGFVLQVTKGFNREILEAIANLERFGQRNLGAGETLGVEAMSGQFIVNDRSTGQPIHVPEQILRAAQ